MDDYAGRVLADRYRLPLPPSDEYELTESRAFDTYSGQEVLVRAVPLPEVVEAEVLDAEGLPDGFTARDGGARGPGARAGTRRPTDPVVRRAVEAAQAAAAIPDHPRLDQVFDVFAEGGSLWIVSELVAARPLAALLAEKPLTPYRAAEVASDVLMALRVLHGHGWVHRNITARTVLVCDDGRVMLTGLAVGAAEEALCGYDPVPAPAFGEPGRETGGAGTAEGVGGPGGAGGSGGVGGPGGGGAGDPEAARRAAIEAREARGLPTAGADAGSGGSPVPARKSAEDSEDPRAARAGAIAAYRAGARAAARVQETQNGRAALPGARPAPEAGPGPHGNGSAQAPYVPGQSAGPGGTAPGQIADPYGVGGARRTTGWHGATPRGGTGGTPSPQGQEQTALPPAPDTAAPGEPTRWDDLVAHTPAPRRGPATALAAERARQARMAVVGPVTERWAPEQAGPVHENWQLAAPIGPATDLWALGALLFRAVQGHAPYPEESTAELVQMVCAEPPAYAEECGPLRPVVESLLRQDPTERLDFEELRGWLRSLVRSAPEPEAGVHVVAAPPVDASRLPVVRRRGELVRRRRAGLPAHHGRHKRAKESRSPHRLGRTLLLLVLLVMAAAIAYAMLFMPKSQTDGAAGTDRTGVAGEARPGTRAGGQRRAPDRPDVTRAREEPVDVGRFHADADHRPRGRRRLHPAQGRGGLPGRRRQGLGPHRAGWQRPGRLREGRLRAHRRTGPGQRVGARQRSDGLPAGEGARAAAVPRLQLGHLHGAEDDRGGRADHGRGAVHLERRRRGRAVCAQPRDARRRAVPRGPGARPGVRTGRGDAVVRAGGGDVPGDEMIF
ncbi:hypothetical protein QF034_004950 [Streptomyces africanus]|uniref:Protein kinase domain-containing protein n=1 Tax=Streptomyces africanus TaxID=231024 RepID=A0ABU0QVZ3_9ACTN|nr:hypothetical protein [Streptomyces africanus]